jgi:hypothetical protein
MVHKIIHSLLIAAFIVTSLTACTPEGQAQETKPALTQTIEGLAAVDPNGEVVLEEGVEIVVESATPDKIQAAIDQDKTRQASFTATPEATSTPEATPTPQVKELPDSFSFLPREQVEKGNPFINDVGGYKMWGIPFKLRPQDIHYDEPFTMLDGRYIVQVWADAWFQEKVRNANGQYEDGPAYHVTIPVMIFDHERHAVWALGTHVVPDWSQSPLENRWVAYELFTGPALENGFVEAQVKMMCLTDSGDRACGPNYSLKIGSDHVSTQALNSNRFIVNALPNFEFWRDLIEGVYTQEKIDQFAETLDISLLQLDLQENLPKNFIIPMFAN